MSRLYDRIIARGGTREPTPVDVDRFFTRDDESWRTTNAKSDVEAVDQMMKSGQFPTRAEAERAFRIVNARLEFFSDYPQIEADHLADAPLFVADQMAEYLTLLEPSDIRDVIGPIAPVYDRFFIEVQGVPILPDAASSPYAWGVLFDSEPLDAAGPDEPAWTLRMFTVVEWEKGDPVGPIGHGELDVAADGSWLGVDKGWRATVARFRSIRPDGSTSEPSPVEPEHIGMMNPYFLAPLQALSLLHCRNVTTRTVEPPPKLSKAHQKRKGGPLHRHHVIEVDQFTQLLDQKGQARQQGIRHALHACRGHFKTYTEDAPLMGRHVGTYWWAPSVRGSAKLGIVTTDYNVKSPKPADLGVPYKEVAEDTVPRRPLAADDPDGTGPGLRAHNRTQNALADHLRANGQFARTPADGEPLYDLAWGSPSEQFIVEVKSITDSNVERQLRIATGQVLRYQDLMDREGVTTHAIVCASQKPEDDSWVPFLEKHGILLTWAPDFPGVPPT